MQIKTAIEDIGFGAEVLTEMSRDELLLSIPCLSSASNAVTVETFLRESRGVTSVVVDPLTEQCHIHYDPAITGARHIISNLKTVGLLLYKNLFLNHLDWI